MGRERTRSPSAGEVLWGLGLLVAGAWGAGAPFVAAAGEVGLTTKLVDHVVPGAIIIVAAAAVSLAAAIRSSPVPDSYVLLAAGAASLAAFFMTVAHVPLMLGASAPLGDILVHGVPGPVAFGLAVWRGASALVRM